jgi:hypothetical protein
VGVSRRITRRAVAPAALLIAGVALAACPRPLQREGAEAEGAVGDAASPASIAPDAELVLHAPSLGALQQAGGVLLRALDAPGGALEGFAGTLDQLVGADASSQRTARLAGLDPDGPLTLSFRPTGDLVAALPVADASAASRALSALARARGAKEDPPAGRVRSFSDDEGVALLALTSSSSALLAPAPVDALGSAALLERMARGGVEGGLEVTPQPGAVVVGRARPGGLHRVAPTLAALLPLDGVEDVLLAARGERGGAALRITLVGRPAVSAPTQPPAGFCGLLDGALLAARFPAAWAAGQEGGPGKHLTSELGLAIYAPLVAGAGLRWVAISRPRDAAAVAALRAQVEVEGAEVTEREIGGRKARVVRADQASKRAIVSIVEEDLFVLAAGEPAQLRAALEGRAACGDATIVAGEAWARSRPAALARVVAGLPPAERADPVTALARVAARVDLGGEQLTLRVSREGRTRHVDLKLISGR